MSLKAGVRVGRVLQPYDALQRLYAIIEIEPVDDISDWHLIRITTPRTDGIHVVGYLGNRDAWITKRVVGYDAPNDWIITRGGSCYELGAPKWQADHDLDCVTRWALRSWGHMAD
jgi:hypothetical protein